MVHRLQRIMPGAPMPATALQWNQLIDGAQFADAERVHVGSPEPPPGFWGTVTRVKNGTTVPLSRGDYIVAESVSIEPSAAEDLFWQAPLLRGNPSDWIGSVNQWGKAAICAEAIPQDEFGWAYPTGIALAKLRLRYAYHDHCDVDSGDENILESHPSGSWEILWTDAVPQSGSAYGWAVLKHRGIWDRTLQGSAQQEIAGGASGNVEIYYDGASTGEVVNAEYRWAEGPSIGASDLCELEWQSDEKIWTVAKIGTTGGTTDPTVSARFAVSVSEFTGSLAEIPVSATNHSDPSADITEVGGRVVVNSAGFYSYEYNLVVTPPDDLTLPSANIIDTRTIEILASGGRHTPNNIARQLYTTTLWRDGDQAVNPTSPYVQVKGTEGSVSGSAIFETEAGGGPGPFILLGTAEFAASGWSINGDIMVARLRRF